MLSLEEKRKILNSFEELTERVDEFGRHFYYFYDSNSERKILGREFVESGDGYIYGEVLPEYEDLCDDRGWVHVKTLSESDLSSLVRKIIDYHK